LKGYFGTVTFPTPAMFGTGSALRHPRLQYEEGLGWHVGRQGVGAEKPSLSELEQVLYDKYQRLRNCVHALTPESFPHEGRQVQLIGSHGYCACGLFLYRYFASEIVYRAEILATIAHEGQRRKYSDAPYISHPQQVFHQVEWHVVEPRSKWEVMGAAAWLHDVLEDCPQISATVIKNKCGQPVLELVQELTNPSKGSRAPRAVRKQMDRDHLKVVSPEAKLIKLIDRNCNLRDMDRCDDPGFMRLYARESLQLLECLRGTDMGQERSLEKNARWLMYRADEREGKIRTLTQAEAKTALVAYAVQYGEDYVEKNTGQVLRVAKFFADTANLPLKTKFVDPQGEVVTLIDGFGNVAVDAEGHVVALPQHILRDFYQKPSDSQGLRAT